MDEHKHHTTEHLSTSTHHKITEDGKERKPVDSKKSLITVFIILGIIVVVIAALIFLSKYLSNNKSAGAIEYNHYAFQKYEGNKWMTQQMIRGKLYDIPFYYNPTQVLDIPIDPYSISRIRNFSYNPNGTVYVSVDPNESSKVVLAAVEYVRILGKQYDIYNMDVKSAINKPVVNQTTDYSIVTCKNQSINTLVIYQTISDKNLVSVKGNCIIIEAINATETVRVADAFSFKLLDIIPLNT